jgi:hypothetical protein
MGRWIGWVSGGAMTLPKPRQEVSRSRTVIVRRAGTVSSSWASMRLQHPAVRQLRQPAIDRVVEPQLPPAVVVPTASTRTSSPRATSVTIPGMSPRATKPAIAASRLSLLIVAP